MAETNKTLNIIMIGSTTCLIYQRYSNKIFGILESFDDCPTRDRSKQGTMWQGATPIQVRFYFIGQNAQLVP